MQIVLLGTAAGGGVPQWNCWCPTCRAARRQPDRVHPRTQSSIAISADGIQWFLGNASPDVREQLRRLPGPTAEDPEVVRQVPLEAVVLTDAELDHSLGIVLLREARSLGLYATAATADILERDSHLLPVTRAFASVTVTPLLLDTAVPLLDRAGKATGLSAEAFAVHGDPPRFAGADHPGHTVGLLLHDEATGGTAAYVPGCGAIDDALVTRLRRAQAVLFNGTFWADDELLALGISPLSARAMGHVPISGPDGSLALLNQLPARVRVYTHINNSNPILLEDSAPRTAVRAAGVVVGDDGMTLSV